MTAELLRFGWTLQKTHDLERLLQALIAHASELAEPASPLCAALAEAYFSDRYPGFDLDDPDWPALRAQVEEVAALLAAVQARVAASPRRTRRHPDGVNDIAWLFRELQ